MESLTLIYSLWIIPRMPPSKIPLTSQPPEATNFLEPLTKLMKNLTEDPSANQMPAQFRRLSTDSYRASRLGPKPTYTPTHAVHDNATQTTITSNSLSRNHRLNFLIDVL